MLKINYKIQNQLTYKGVEYKVNMAFDNILRLYELLDDDELSNESKVFIGIKMLLGIELNMDIESQAQLFNILIKEFIQDKEVKPQLDRKGNPLPIKKDKPVYCFNHDAEFIYSSFIQAYGIDLIEEQGKLQLLKFKALLNGLPEDTKFRQVIDIRTKPLPKGKGSAEERKSLKELKKIYALPGEDNEE